jgi:hypothetical protein
MLPYPGGADGMVGIEGIQFGPGGSVFIAHNGYFHYGDPGSPAAPLQWPRTNIVAEYMLPTLGSEDLDLFALLDASPSGADCALQFGSVLDAVKTLPAVGLFLNDSTPRVQLRKNNNGGGSVVDLAHTFTGPALIYVTVRGAEVTFYIDGVTAGSGTLGADGLGHWGPVHPPELGGRTYQRQPLCRDGFPCRRRGAGVRRRSTGDRGRHRPSPRSAGSASRGPSFQIHSALRGDFRCPTPAL